MSYDKPTIPLNALPLASNEGRPLPANVYRPAFCYSLENDTLELPDQINLIEVQVTTEAVLLRDNAALLMRGAEVPTEIALGSELGRLGVNRLTQGNHLLIVGPSITIAGQAWINGRTIWQAAAPTTHWRTKR